MLSDQHGCIFRGWFGLQGNTATIYITSFINCYLHNGLNYGWRRETLLCPLMWIWCVVQVTSGQTGDIDEGGLRVWRLYGCPNPGRCCVTTATVCWWCVSVSVSVKTCLSCCPAQTWCPLQPHMGPPWTCENSHRVRRTCTHTHAISVCLSPHVTLSSSLSRLTSSQTLPLLRLWRQLVLHFLLLHVMWRTNNNLCPFKCS